MCYFNYSILINLYNAFRSVTYGNCLKNNSELFLIASLILFDWQIPLVGSLHVAEKQFLVASMYVRQFVKVPTFQIVFQYGNLVIFIGNFYRQVPVFTYVDNNTKREISRKNICLEPSERKLSGR